MQLRYNTYDRAPMPSLPGGGTRELYRALAALEHSLALPANQVELDLEPGTVLLVDNWRVTHARTNYTGPRQLSGCYISRSEWTSRARCLGLL